MPLIDPLEILAGSDFSLEYEEGSVQTIRIGVGCLESLQNQTVFYICPGQGVFNIAYKPEPENKNRVAEMRQFADKGFTLVRLASGETYAIYNKPEAFSNMESREGAIDAYRIRRREILMARQNGA